MMKKSCTILLLLVLSIIGYAQNQFVYVRYNPRHGNASAIIRTIDNLMNKMTGKTIVFVSHASTPMVATNSTQWEEIRAHILGMQTAYEYYAEDEAAILNTYFADLFKETVTKNLHIIGPYDHSWVCTFIISETMLQSDDFEYLAENISVNELASRMSVDVLTYNESQRLSTAEIASNTMFKFKLTE